MRTVRGVRPTRLLACTTLVVKVSVYNVGVLMRAGVRALPHVEVNAQIVESQETRRDSVDG